MESDEYHLCDAHFKPTPSSSSGICNEVLFFYANGCGQYSVQTPSRRCFTWVRLYHKYTDLVMNKALLMFWLLFDWLVFNSFARACTIVVHIVVIIKKTFDDILIGGWGHVSQRHLIRL